MRTFALVLLVLNCIGMCTPPFDIWNILCGISVVIYFLALVLP